MSNKRAQERAERDEKRPPADHVLAPVSNVSPGSKQRQYAEAKAKEEKPPRQKTAQGDSRFQPFYSHAHQSYQQKHGAEPIWTGKDRNGLKGLLKDQSPNVLPLERLNSLWDSFLASTEPFTLKQGDSLAYFCSNIGKFANGPILSASQKGGTYGKASSISTTLAGYQQLERTAETGQSN
jgi:hypothetical protein